ncbi:hypothetical protein BCR33DRAFT_787206 [Rhizoclosmatium globosum]|uniref:Uncharacterized protein n=1 Tax=Rhizoclosmatium globosum TaxID=329046 RepID=A0A1Y2C273_9FUNG|nr:hypothetical protein BCR33DRAFT_787206 [Rhizoclosmatium globosum]|eukprot:ORY40977.1 hypothetical protein BCR33DRAFT_787206 [Rhizoclosmatium globosum]
MSSFSPASFESPPDLDRFATLPTPLSRFIPDAAIKESANESTSVFNISLIFTASHTGLPPKQRKYFSEIVEKKWFTSYDEACIMAVLQYIYTAPVINRFSLVNLRLLIKERLALKQTVQELMFRLATIEMEKDESVQSKPQVITSGLPPFGKRRRDSESLAPKEDKLKKVDILPSNVKVETSTTLNNQPTTPAGFLVPPIEQDFRFSTSGYQTMSPSFIILLLSHF